MNIGSSLDSFYLEEGMFEWVPDSTWPDGSVWDLYINDNHVGWVGRNDPLFGNNIFAHCKLWDKDSNNFTSFRDASLWLLTQVM